MRARELWIWLCITLMCVLFWAPIIPPLTYSVYFELIEQVGGEYMYSKGIGGSHGSGLNVLQSDRQNHGEFMWVMFDKLDSMVYWDTFVPASKKLKVKSSLAKGDAILKITQGDKWHIQKIPLVSGEEKVIDVSEWSMDESIILWLIVSDGENGQFIITPVEEPS